MAATRSWTRRLDELLIAPNATPGERLLGYGAAVLGAILAAGLAIAAGLDPWIVALLIVIGFDLFGGAVVNATPAGSRRFHGVGVPRWRALGFVALHVHPLLLALLMPEMPWTTAIVAYAGLVLGTVLATLAPDSLRPAVAFLCASVLIAVAVTVLPAAPVVAWVVPVLVVKLLLSHLLPHR